MQSQHYLKNLLLPGALSGLLALTSCAKDPIEHRLSADQLAWQPYRMNDVLRFGNGRSSQVRTYRITSLQDQMERQYTGTNFTPFPSSKHDCQHLTALVQRTDSAAVVETAIDLELSYYDELTLRAAAGWDNCYPAPLPLDEINQGLPIDTLRYPGTALLPTFKSGPATYGPVIRITYRYPTTVPNKPTRQLYCAKGYGVVGFVEGTTLWYRLP